MHMFLTRPETSLITIHVNCEVACSESGTCMTGSVVEGILIVMLERYNGKYEV